MTVEVTSEETQVQDVEVGKQEPIAKVTEEAVEEGRVEDGAQDEKPEQPRTVELAEKEKNEKMEDEKKKKEETVEKRDSFREESSLLSDLKEYEKKSLIELRAKVEEAILENKIYKEEKEKPAIQGQENEKSSSPEGVLMEKSVKENEGKELSSETILQELSEKEKSFEENEEQKQPPTLEDEGEEKEKSTSTELERQVVDTEVPEEKGQETVLEGKEEEIEVKSIEIDTNVSLWGVPLLPSKGFDSTDVVLLKFLRAREFKVNEAFTMLKNTIQWRKDAKIDSILEEDLGSDLDSVAFMNGTDREGHQVCYNIYGKFDDEELYQKTFGTEEQRQRFLRWRIQLMERGIRNLNFKPGGISSLLQINDLKNSPGLAKKEVRLAMKQAVGLLQDNYPEFVARNIFINVPFWYYAFNAILSPFLTQRTKSKFVFARPAKVTETLLRYISAEQVPIHYGGLKRENDVDFTEEDAGFTELILKANSTENVELPVPDVGTTLIWDINVLGWEVNYKEEFVPTNEGSYTIIVQKEKKIGAHEEALRNSYKNNEPGKIVLTIENNSFKKKKILYRYKAKCN